MKWYFTPDLGNYGAAVRFDEHGNMCCVAFCVVGPDGTMAFLKWAPPESGMCNAKSYQSSPMTLFETNEEQAEKLNQLFGSKIIRNLNGGPRLIK